MKHRFDTDGNIFLTADYADFGENFGHRDTENTAPER
jgi:hypothetical protein